MEIMGGIGDSFIEESEPVQKAATALSDKKPIRAWRFAPIAACAVIAIVSVLVFKSVESGQNPPLTTEIIGGGSGNNTELPNQTQSDNTKPVPGSANATNGSNNNADLPNQTYVPGDITQHEGVQVPYVTDGHDNISRPVMSFAINELPSEPNIIANNINLLWEDAVSQTPSTLQQYYGIKIYPARSMLPVNFRKDIIVDDSSYGHFWLFQNDERGIYYDQNTILYESEEAALQHEQMGYRDLSLPSITVTVSKESTIRWDIAIEEMLDATPEKSDIGGNELTILQYSDSYGSHFVAYFVKEGVNFEIYGNLISQEEFIDLLVGYLG
jgi:hypothetical protein